MLLRPEQEWEGRSAAATGRRWNEGSYLMRHEGRYYMTYSGNFLQGRIMQWAMLLQRTH